MSRSLQVYYCYLVPPALRRRSFRGDINFTEPEEGDVEDEAVGGASIFDQTDDLLLGLLSSIVCRVSKSIGE